MSNRTRSKRLSFSVSRPNWASRTRSLGLTSSSNKAKVRHAARDPRTALQSYLAAAKAGNFVALAFSAKLLSHSAQLERADALWDRFFAKLKANHEHAFIVAGRGELLHDYITTQLQLGTRPRR
jgi:hypothetical protein